MHIVFIFYTNIVHFNKYHFLYPEYSDLGRTVYSLNTLPALSTMSKGVHVIIINYKLDMVTVFSSPLFREVCSFILQGE